MNNSTNLDFTKLRRHIILKMPCYKISGLPYHFYKSHQKNSGIKKSYFKYIRLKIADWISQGKISETIKWHDELLELLAILTKDMMYDDIKKMNKDY